MRTHPLSLSIVIAASSRTEKLSRTIQSLASCDFPSCYNKTVIVENGDSATLRHLSSTNTGIPNLQYIFRSRPGKTSALNAALRAIEDGLIFFTDDDITFHSDILNAYVHAAESAPKRAYFGGPHETPKNRVIPTHIKAYLPASAQDRIHNPVTKDRRFTGFMGFNWAAYAHDLRATGGFDPRLGPGSTLNSVGDETEMQIRLQESGCEPIFVPDARVEHRVSPATYTEEWILDRRYREALWPGWTLCAKHLASNKTHTPVWLYMNWITQGLRSIVARSFASDRRFIEAYQFAWHRGFLTGYTRAKRRDDLLLSVSAITGMNGRSKATSSL
ncbi:glycosyltransferase [Longibacter salinarum]|nr:glycosyltransferase [Longibacter salinarum]